MFVCSQMSLIKVFMTFCDAPGFILDISAIYTEFESVECGYKCDFQLCAGVYFEEGKDIDSGASGFAGLNWRLGPRPVHNAGLSMCS